MVVLIWLMIMRGLYLTDMYICSCQREIEASELGAGSGKRMKL
jgi:hypothetical protein